MNQSRAISRHLFVALGLSAPALLLAALHPLGCGRAADDVVETDEATQEIHNGTVAPNNATYPSSYNVMMNRTGLCSGALLTNQWVLTATHCFPIDCTTDPDICSDPVEYNIGTSGTVLTPFACSGAGCSRTANGNWRLIRHPSIYNTFRNGADGVDVALIRTNTPFNVNGSTTNLTGSPGHIWKGDPHNLVGLDVRQYGYGVNLCDAGTGTGVLRFADVPVDSVIDNNAHQDRRLGFVLKSSDQNQIIQPGDSGGPTFFLDADNQWRIAAINTAGSCTNTSASSSTAFRTWAITMIHGGWGRDLGWCQLPHQRLLVSEVDNDSVAPAEQSDLLCHDTSTGRIYVNTAHNSMVAGFTGTQTGTPNPGLFGPTNWTSPANEPFCTAADGVSYMGDFNDDGRGDLLCRLSNGKLRIVLAQSGGSFQTSSPSTSASTFCTGSGKQLFIADTSGEGRADVICHDPATGFQSIAKADASGNIDIAGAFVGSIEYCKSTTGNLHVGDFDNDGKADLLCHNTSDGRTWIAYMGASAPDYANLFSSSFDYCSGSNGRLFTGNFDGQNGDDLLCHNVSTGAKWIAYTGVTGQPNYGAVWSAAMRWCNEAGDSMAVGDFNGDGRADLLCDNKADGALPLLGRQYIVYAKSGGVFTVD